MIEVRNVSYDDANEVIVINEGEIFCSIISKDDGTAQFSFDCKADYSEAELEEMANTFLKWIGEEIRALDQTSDRKS